MWNSFIERITEIWRHGTMRRKYILLFFFYLKLLSFFPLLLRCCCSFVYLFCYIKIFGAAYEITTKNNFFFVGLSLLLCLCYSFMIVCIRLRLHNIYLSFVFCSFVFTPDPIFAVRKSTINP